MAPQSPEKPTFQPIDMATAPPSLFILGVGNTLRTDDGIGIFICEHIAALPLDHADVSFTPDLSTNWLELFASFDRVVIVDACAGGGETIQFGRAGSHPHPPARVSHYLDAESLPELLGALYDEKPEILLCSVPANDFGMGEGLSKKGREMAEQAIGILRGWLQEEGYLLPE